MHFLHEQSVAYGSLFGEVGLLGTYAALAPKRSWALLEAANAGDARRSAELGAWFARLADDVFQPLMAVRRVDGAYDKTIAKLSAGLGDFPLRMLSPYRSITDEEFATAHHHRPELEVEVPAARVQCQKTFDVSGVEEPALPADVREQQGGEELGEVASQPGRNRHGKAVLRAIDDRVRQDAAHRLLEQGTSWCRRAGVRRGNRRREFQRAGDRAAAAVPPANAPWSSDRPSSGCRAADLGGGRSMDRQPVVAIVQARSSRLRHRCRAAAAR